ncbi:MAG: hypothetical protein Q4E56_02730 [Pseudomonadota bacterium]|nr:hypothetical protein [Pseudomonadota bacterium]
MSLGVPTMGCNDPCTSVDSTIIWRAVCAVFCITTKKQSPDLLVRRVAEYQISNTILVIVVNLLATCENWWFLIIKKQEMET